MRNFPVRFSGWRRAGDKLQTLSQLYIDFHLLVDGGGCAEGVGWPRLAVCLLQIRPKMSRSAMTTPTHHALIKFCFLYLLSIWLIAISARIPAKAKGEKDKHIKKFACEAHASVGSSS